MREASPEKKESYIDIIKSRITPLSPLSPLAPLSPVSVQAEKENNEQEHEIDNVSKSGKNDTVKTKEGILIMELPKTVKVNKMSRRSHSQSQLYNQYEYFHCGNFTQFNYETQEAWSCCMNNDQNSKVIF